ncbi:MAG: hypothetical protein WC213_05545 [Arenimonas sp.]
MLLAFTATAVRAQPKAPEATLPANPAATQQSTPIDLALHPAAAPQSTPIDLALHPAAAPQSTPIDLALHPAAAPQSTPIDLALHPAAAPQSTPIDLALHPAAAPQSGPIDLALESASAEVKRVARWVVDSGDNVGLPFLLIDKLNAQVFVFGPAGQLRGAAPALLGMGRGDRMLVSNDTKMSAMPPQVRITPAGRFVSRLAKDSKGKELLVLDYEASLSLHPVVKGTPAERRAERLKSATAQDNRISFGCINVPVPFYAAVVSPAFTGTKGIVYVLPETGPASALFGLKPDGAAVAGAQLSSPAPNAPAAQTGPAPGAR